MGAPSALVIGYLSDRVNRRNLLFAIVLLGAPRRLLLFALRALLAHRAAPTGDAGYISPTTCVSASRARKDPLAGVAKAACRAAAPRGCRAAR